jgi:hypothetical protein
MSENFHLATLKQIEIPAVNCWLLASNYDCVFKVRIITAAELPIVCASKVLLKI